MNCYLITFALTQPEENFDKLVEAVKGLGDWGRISNLTYLLHSPEPQPYIFQTLKEVLKEGDHLFVLSVKRPFYGQGPDDLSDWMDQVLPY